MDSEREETRFRPQNRTEPYTGTMVGRCAVPISGQDKGRYFLIVGVTDDGMLLLADGKRHRLDRPKKKKPKHAAVLSSDALIGTSGDMKSLTDAEIRRLLAGFRRGMTGSGNV